MPSNYVILLPPSEGKLEGGVKEYGCVKGENSNQSLSSARQTLYNALLLYINTASIEGLQKLFGVKQSAIALQAKELIQNQNKQLALPAISRYTGVMFKHFGYEVLPQHCKQNAVNTILFIDGMFGLLKISDFIPNYKLSIGAKFTVNGTLFNVAKYWNKHLASHLTNAFAGKIVLDFLPQAHRAAIAQEAAAKNYYKINFYEVKNGTPCNSGHASKQLKGEFINYILQNKTIGMQTIMQFQHSKGYKYSNELSCKQDIIFLKQ